MAVCSPACLISRDKMWQENFHLLKHYVLISLFFLALVHLEPAGVSAGTLGLEALSTCPAPQNSELWLSTSRAELRDWDFPSLISPHI